jgi:hypothetical protein
MQAVLTARRPRRQVRLANRTEGEIDERPNFCRRLAARGIEDVEWKPLVRPIGKQVDQLPGVQILLGTDPNHLSDSRAGKTLGDHGPDVTNQKAAIGRQAQDLAFAVKLPDERAPG